MILLKCPKHPLFNTTSEKMSQTCIDTYRKISESRKLAENVWEVVLVNLASFDADHSSPLKTKRQNKNKKTNQENNSGQTQALKSGRQYLWTTAFLPH